MQMVDGLAQRYGQHPDAIVHGDTYVFRVVNTLDAYGLLSPRRREQEPGVPATFPDFDDDPEGLAAFTGTIG